MNILTQATNPPGFWVTIPVYQAQLFALEVKDTRWKSWTGGKTDVQLTQKVWFLQAIQEAQKIYEDAYEDYMKNPVGKVNSTIYRYHVAVSTRHLKHLIHCPTVTLPIRAQNSSLWAVAK